jgi:tRNA threonylcarbamoyladenosine biosynthesis protein TsaB
MRVLAVDTALGACSAAVLEDSVLLARRHEAMQRGHAEALAPMVRDAMQDAGLAFAALDRLAVTTGPGTFTGQRVGLAFIRAMRLALKIPAIGVTTLDAMAAEALERTGAPLAAAVADARRGEVYLGAREAAGVLIAPVLLSMAEAAAALAAQGRGVLALAGGGAGLVAPLLEQAGIAVVPSGVTVPDALYAAKLALKAPELREPPRPLYLRAPDAKLPASVLRIPGDES